MWSSVISQAIGINLTDIILKNLHKSFGNFVAVQNTDLTIKNGEFFVLLGPSGCGKTTLLNLIAGLDKAYTGSISFGKNKAVYNLNKAFMFQTPRLLPWLNVQQNVEVVLNKNIVDNIVDNIYYQIL